MRSLETKTFQDFQALTTDSSQQTNNFEIYIILLLQNSNVGERGW